MTIQSILLPVFVLVVLIFFMVFWTLKERMMPSRGIVATSLPGRGTQVTAEQTSACFKNQCELPPLFFVLVILAIITRKADVVFVVMSWLFVIARIAHAAIFCTTNHFRNRGLAFLAGAVILCLMWVIFALRILVSPTFATL